ncbi:MAG: J domain-containing protein [Pseudomonadota bacterium]
MNLNSKYFDGIRIQRGTKKKEEVPKTRTCQWKGCNAKAQFRAPRGRGQEGRFYWFCAEHVREYNKKYNYFTGLSDDEAWNARMGSDTGERPTWKMGVNGWSPNGRRRIFAGQTYQGFKVNDTFDVFEGERFEGEHRKEPKRERPVRRLEQRALDTLNLDASATSEDIRTRYKELVKAHHPDANGGDRGSEERLRDVIQAYKHLKSAGFC